ncbi:MAG: hypothetical protein A2Y62_09120 [Candidatus Fischerbacteria bacterium RBG_13_37_8]|uniref:Uroporphyrinogen decarboxylase (URO-D) domain-containing protein n=1 Tax=Candidatus Fischerbacteria bacterium RBG_13_37_8 TaxID=1817863 RepID=A0A1F5VUM6_9BACT|nr:MAG: hypothetical protein A2Y62_09120 [Candidatus Fischerbacteria bacterium RBG_13_37_8]
MNLSFKKDGSAPFFENPVRDKNHVDHLRIPDPFESNDYLMHAIRLVKNTLSADKPLIGFTGSPWTLAAFMTEGEITKNLEVAKALLYREPELLMQLLNKITEAVKLYVEAQIIAGANIIQIFDSLAGHLSKHDFLQYSLPYISDVVKYIKLKYGTRIPVIVFARGASHSIMEIQQIGSDVISIDWTLSIKEAMALTGNTITLQGNLDPVVLLASQPRIAGKVRELMLEAIELKGFIFNLGHGILATTPEANVRYLVDYVHERSTMLKLE